MRILKIYIIAVLTVFLIVLFKPLNIKAEEVILKSEALEYVSEFHEDTFSKELINYIYEEKLIYINKFSETNFIKSQNKNWQFYIKDYQFMNLIDQKRESMLVLNNYLFKDSINSNYYVIITYSHNNRIYHKPFIEIHYSNRYQLVKYDKGVSLNYNDKEYIKSPNDSFDHNNNFYELSTYTSSNPLKRTKSKGYMIFELQAKEEIENKYIDILINYIEPFEKRSNHILLGFNGFNTKNEMYYYANSFTTNYWEAL